MKGIMKVIGIGAVGIAVLTTSAAQADVWYFDVNITHDQHVPPTGSEATGHATIVYDDETNLLSADIYIEGILHEDLLYGHLHEGRLGYYGEMIAHLGHAHMWEHHGNGLRRVVTDLPIDEMWEDDLLTDGAYVNIHTVQWEAGEIRGQALATPRLSTTALRRGERATFNITRARPRERVYVLYSMAGLGAGPSIEQLGGLTLDILGPVQIAASMVANQRGSAAISVTIPANAPPFPVFLQAVIRRGVDGSESVRSNTVSTAILP